MLHASRYRRIYKLKMTRLRSCECFLKASYTSNVLLMKVFLKKPVHYHGCAVEDHDCDNACYSKEQSNLSRIIH